jgi:preprotein translocase subunit SecG
MIAGWYLILFIITIIFLLFVASFNIYEQQRIKTKCKDCVENQDMLLILNAISIFLVVCLLFGYFFGRQSKADIQKAQNQGQPTLSSLLPFTQTSGQVTGQMATGQMATGQMATGQCSTGQCSTGQVTGQGINSIDIISKI